MSKLRIYIQLLFWALLPTLMGCSADDSLVLLPNIPEEEPMEIRLYATTLAQADAVVTRISNGSFEAEDEIGVCITNYYENTLFTLEGGYFTPNDACYFPLNEEEVTISAYYPYSASISNGKLPVKSSISNMNEGDWANATTDPLWATNIIQKPIRSTTTTTTANVEMAFQHQLACLQVKADDDVTMNSITITFKNGQYGYLTISNGQITSANPDASQAQTWNIEDETNTSTGLSINERFLPNEDAISSISINDNGVNKIIFPNDTTNKISLVSGKVTKIRISKGNNASTRNNDEICLSIEE